MVEIGALLRRFSVKAGTWVRIPHSPPVVAALGGPFVAPEGLDAALAQLVEHLPCKREVVCSNQTRGTNPLGFD